MIRGMTIRFAIMGVGFVPFVWAANYFEPAAGIVMAALIAYVTGGSFLVGNYIIDHEDEIPTPAERRQRRRERSARR